MTREEAIQLIDEIASSYYPCGKKDALEMAIKALEPKPYEKFESAKDHIYKLAGDYKCWDNRLTEDEAVELCHILEQQPCEDAISRQEVIETLKELDWRYNGHPGGEVYSAIYKLPPVQPKPKTGWIPVSERLPEIRQHVLCQCRGNAYSVLRLNQDSDWECIYPHTTYMQSFVIAWMPLPEPYEPQESEGEK